MYAQLFSSPTKYDGLEAKQRAINLSSNQYQVWDCGVFLLLTLKDPWQKVAGKGRARHSNR